MQEVFELQFKNSIRYGMTYEQFWCDNPQLYYIYEEAYKDQMEDRLKEKDVLNWQFGIYLDYAIGHWLGKNVKYPDKPLFFAKQEEKPKDVYDMMERFKGMVAQVNGNFK
jgi:hypothetical protein